MDERFDEMIKTTNRPTLRSTVKASYSDKKKRKETSVA